ncbi:B12-binding domain-containing protein [Streptomyces sp. NPDC004267]|uniref:B12-binding domain-containing protein n=1 Tax=Streptomyces sp. NPDC004267 TaxID=3364694 RepID=UPI00368E5FBE
MGALETRDEPAATAAVLGAHDAGVPAEDLLLDVIGSVQAGIGAEWAAGRIGVAQEHAAIAIQDRAFTAFTESRHHRRIRREGTRCNRDGTGQADTAPAR